VPFHHFYTFDEARQYLVRERGCMLMGVEIEPSMSLLTFCA